MQIDWFTYFAQIVNFLILLFLLRRYLYGPIVEAMDKREAMIASRVEEANRLRHTAEKDADASREMRERLKHEQHSMMAEAREKVALWRKDHLHEAREEIAGIKDNWQKSLSRQKGTFLRELQRYTGEQVLSVTRRLLEDLADASLEKQVIRVFVRRLGLLEGEDLIRLKSLVQEKPDAEVVIRTNFDVGEGNLQSVSDTLTELIGIQISPRYEVTSDSGFGIEMRIEGWTMRWSLNEYLDALDSRMQEVLDEMIGEPTE